jgi:Spy/CpxP family protein refolding chaperone
MKVQALLVAALLCSSLSGCGAALARSGAADAASAPTYHLANADGGRKQHHGRRAGGKLVAELGLTPEQIASLKALAAKRRTAAPGKQDWQAMKADRQRFTQLWTAEKLDTAALSALLKSHQAAGGARREGRLGLLVEAREILTQAQRDKLAGMLEARATAMASHKPRTPRQGKNPANLTPDQQAKFQALAAKRGGGNHMRALAAFARTGDRAALASTMASPSLVDDFVALAATLSKDQRIALGHRAMAWAGFGFGGGMRGHHPGGRRGHRPGKPA